MNSKKTFPELSAIEKVMRSTDTEEMHAERQPAGLNTESMASHHGQNNLFEKANGKGNYTINIPTLVKLAEQSATLNNQLYELAAPVLIQQLKNDSKVRMNQAFELMGASLLRDKDGREFARSR